MRFPKISLKRCFLVVITFAILLFFVVTLRDRDLWNNTGGGKSPANNVPWNSESSESGGGANSKSSANKEQARQLDNSNNNNINHHHNYGKDSAKFPLDGLEQAEQEEAKKKSKKANKLKGAYYDEVVYQGGGGEANGRQSGNDLSDPDTVVVVNGESTQELPWYFLTGDRYPKPAIRNRKTKRRVARLLPSEDPHNDRITNQLMFVPPNYEQMRSENRNKVILLFNGLSQWNVKGGREVFLNNKCPVDTCTLTENREMASKADMLLYKDHYVNSGATRSMNQIYMIYYLECPYHTPNMPFADVFNWTATYRKDSDVVAPYEKWEYFDPRVKQLEQDRSYAFNKTKKVAWFVSNCNARNNRLQYANELAKHIEVDIYGYCGSFHCPRTQSSKCFEILDTDYKFYLAFENSNCRDYITEKFFVNSLNRNVLPIVMGAPPEDYAAVAPYKSYIHVDEFASPKELAEYLHMLDKNDDLYNGYFKWKGTGEFINTYFWCRVCAMLHDRDTIGAPSKWYADVNEWWNGPGVCTKGSWRAEDARTGSAEHQDE